MSANGQPERYIIVRNWQRFQHYSDRDPPWIKNYTRLLSDENYLGLTVHRRAMLHALWLEYARSGQELSENTLRMSRRLAMKVTMRDLEALNHAGFIEFSLAPKALAPRARSQETETEELKSKEQKPLTETQPEVHYDGFGTGEDLQTLGTTIDQILGARP